MSQSHETPLASSERLREQLSDDSYSDEAAQAILKRALELRATDRFSVQQLREMAAELDIAPDILAAAIADWAAQPPSDSSQASITRTRPRHTKRLKWRQYAVASTLMIGIDLLTAGMLTWSIFPVVGWGLGLMFGGCDRDRQSSGSC